MITVTVQKNCGAATVRARISAPIIERAVELAGEGARLVLPIDGEAFFTPVAEGIDYAAMSREDVEAAFEASLPGSHGAYLDALRDDLGEERFEIYALENCLI